MSQTIDDGTLFYLLTTQIVASPTADFQKFRTEIQGPRFVLGNEADTKPQSPFSNQTDSDRSSHANLVLLFLWKFNDWLYKNKNSQCDSYKMLELV